MRTNMLCWCLLLLSMTIRVGAVTQEQWLDELDQEIARKEIYEKQKQEHLRLLRNRYDSLAQNKQDVYPVLLELFTEYKSYRYDSALLYVEKLKDAAMMQHDANRMQEADLCRGFAYLSAGLFKECDDLMKSANTQEMNQKTLIAYYLTYGRLMYDMADYTKDNLAAEYKTQGNEWMEKALTLINPNDTILYWANAALLDMKQDNYWRAIERFRIALHCESITEHKKAIYYSSMAYMYSLQGDKEQAVFYNVEASKADLRSSTKEIVALQNLAVLLAEQGNVERAATYIRIALDEVSFYDARHRLMSIQTILPIIDKQQLLSIKNQNSRIRVLTWCLYGALAVLMIALLLLYNRMQMLKKAKQTISTINASLLESNLIKEKYIGGLLCAQMENIRHLQTYQQMVRKKVQEKHYDSLLVIPNLLNAQRRKNAFYKHLDEMLLEIFPNFVENFNALLREGEKIELQKGELLNTSLRIYALIRLGVTDNEQISQVLDYSVNTIYTYKTRVRNRSNLSNEEFRKAIMAIPSFEQI